MVILLSLRDLRRRGMSISKSQLYELMSQGSFPKPIKMGNRLNAWIESEYDAWVEARKEERDRDHVPAPVSETEYSATDHHPTT